MEFFTEFPELGRRSQMELRKGIDLAFRNFSKEYGDSIEAFFDPLLFFLVSLEKLLLSTMDNNYWNNLWISLVRF